MPAEGQPLHVVLNAGAGASALVDVRAAIESVLDAAGRRFEIVSPERGAAIRPLADAAVAAAKRSGGIVVAGGGDGTINTVAQSAMRGGVPLGVVPVGTFNYFARAHGIPTDPAQAAQVLLGGVLKPVQVGIVNQRIFLVSASVGLYPTLLEDREAYKSQFGRSRIVALGAALATFLREQRQMRLVLTPDGGAPRAVRTPLVFVGNNRLQLGQIGIDEASEIDRGRLVVLTLKPAGTLAMLLLLVRGAFGSLGDADEVVTLATTGLGVSSSRPGKRALQPIKVASDGEVTMMAPPLAFGISPEPLRLVVPDPALASASA